MFCRGGHIEKEYRQSSSAQLLKELEAGKQSGEELGWLSPLEVREHFSERKERKLGYTELDS